MRFTRRGLLVIAFLVTFTVGVCIGMWRADWEGRHGDDTCRICEKRLAIADRPDICPDCFSQYIHRSELALMHQGTVPGTDMTAPYQKE